MGSFGPKSNSSKCGHMGEKRGEKEESQGLLSSILGLSSVGIRRVKSESSSTQ